MTHRHDSVSTNESCRWFKCSKQAGQSVQRSEEVATEGYDSDKSVVVWAFAVALGTSSVAAGKSTFSNGSRPLSSETATKAGKGRSLTVGNNPRVTTEGFLAAF